MSKFLLFLLISGFSVVLLMAESHAQTEQSFDQMDIESLMEMDVIVTSAAKREQSLSNVSSAMFVINQEDIETSGATSVPDLLRMVPGLHVARIDTQTWAISARGFNDRSSNKLLVLIDGRSVYTPLFSGVNWEKSPGKSKTRSVDVSYFKYFDAIPRYERW